MNKTRYYILYECSVILHREKNSPFLLDGERLFFDGITLFTNRVIKAYNSQIILIYCGTMLICTVGQFLVCL